VAQPVSAVDVANSINYATAATYAPQGALAQVQNGTNLVSTYIYNDRLQPCWMYATTDSALATNTSCTATDSSPGNILDLQYNFSLGSADNGNVVGITNNRDTTRTQSFTYDQVNRILSGQTSATTGANCWGESYTLDEWANLTAIGALSSYSGCTQESLSVSASTANQLSATGFSFDASGNMLTDAVNTYAWNAESEIKSAAGVNYTYDGEGNRLEKSSGKIYWYGAGTEILDESDLSGNFTNEYVFFGGKRIAMRNVSTGAIYYYAEDMLGSSRTLVQAGQTSVCYDADFYPYGGERDIVTTCSQNYKFEGKERDTETNNDDFGARYYSSRLGRWLSADWSAVPAPIPYANLSNPQTLNLYAMVSDNPETFSDLNGHCGSEETVCWENSRYGPPAGTSDPYAPPAGTSDPVIDPSDLVPVIRDGCKVGELCAQDDKKTKPPLDLKQPIVQKQSKPPRPCNQACKDMRHAAELKLLADLAMFGAAFLPEGDEEAFSLEAQAAGLEEQAEAEEAAESRAAADADHAGEGVRGGPKDRSGEGNVDQLKGVEQLQKETNKSSKGQYNLGTDKSKQNIDNTNRRIRSLRDAQDEYGGVI
jgi:RHS repeat-associated protein